MTTKHTPGPWRVDGLLIKAIDHGRWFGIAKAGGSRLTIDGNIANAALIASSPDLLAERDRLREVNAELVAALKTADIELSMGHYTIARDRMRAAIAKAEGAGK